MKNLYALIASLRLFTRLTEDTAAQLSYDYSRGMITEVTDYILG